MIMEKLFKQLGELDIKLKNKFKLNEFFVARIRLTFYYFLMAIVILGGSSIILYKVILSNLTQFISGRVSDFVLAQDIIDRAQDILLNRFLTIDLIIMVFIVVLGFLLTKKTLEPIEENMEKQKRFIADASHELRTPTAIVISGLEVALNNKKLDFSSAKKVIENTLDEMREFSELSNDLLSLSKYDIAGKIKFENLSIDELVNEIVRKNESLARMKNINLKTEVEFPAKVFGNKIELGRVFYNVLDNAIKYTGIGGKIFIVGQNISNKYLITISDTGAGIPKDVLDKIFEPFFRGDIARNTEGAGLGLTLSKKIIENHKGNISVKSEINKGTEVLISLPLSS